MTWFRVDNRLVHGQVIEGWLPYVAARHLVVANDAMAQLPSEAFTAVLKLDETREHNDFGYGRH